MRHVRHRDPRHPRAQRIRHLQADAVSEVKEKAPEGTLGYLTIWPDDPADPMVDHWERSGKNDAVEGLGDNGRFTVVDSVTVVDDRVIYSFSTGAKANMTAFVQAYFDALG